jgi:hypothetical protein
MNRKLVCGFVICGLLTASLSQKVMADQNSADVRAKANTIVNSLFNLVEKHADRNQRVADIVTSMKALIESKELTLEPDLGAPQNIFDGVNFVYSQEKDLSKPRLTYTPYMIALYEKHPSIVYSSLIHGFTLAYQYFGHMSTFKQGYKDDLERYLYEMDAALVEAQFVRDFLKPDGYQLVDMENLLLKSLKEDDLGYYSMCIKKTDRNLVREMYDIADKSISREAQLEEMGKIGSGILNNFHYPADGSDWDKFKSLVPAMTYVKYAAKMIARIENNASSIEIKTIYWSDYPALLKIVNAMKQTINPKIDQIKEYAGNLPKSFKKI